MLRRMLFFFAALTVLTGLIPSAGAQNGSLEGRIIILDAGHGDGGNTYKGYSEGTTMLILAYKIKALLEEHGAEVHLTRDGAAATLLPARAAIINKLALETIRASRLEKLAAEGGEADNPEIAELDRLIAVMQSIIDDPDKSGSVYMNSPYDYSYQRTIHADLQRVFELENDPEIHNRFLMISLHSNATPSPINSSVNGADVYYCSNTLKHNSKYYQNYTYNDLEIFFGNLILDKIDALGIRKRSVLANNWFITREHNVPGVLVEHGFHTNAKDRGKLSDENFLNNLAASYLDAIVSYFDSVAPREFAAPLESEMPLEAEVPLEAEAPLEPDSIPSETAENPWYHDALNFITENNLLPQGEEDPAFSPNDEINAAAFAALLTNLAGLTPSEYEQDGSSTPWQVPPDYLQSPENAVTREDAALIIFDYIRSRQLDHPEQTVSFSDSESISETAREAVTAMLAYGVMVGCTDGFFYPFRTITHAEAAQVCLNLASVLLL